MLGLVECDGEVEADGLTEADGDFDALGLTDAEALPAACCTRNPTNDTSS